MWIHTDHNSGRTGGESPGFALSLVAESTTGVMLVAETAAEKVRGHSYVSSVCIYVCGYRAKSVYAAVKFEDVLQ